MVSIQTEIIERGPVSAGYFIYEDFQNIFGGEGLGGQLHGPGDPVVGNTKNSLIYMHIDKPNEEPIGGHAITITGWGVYQNIPYWICLNSWGIEWGTSGYTKYSQRNSLPVDQKGGGYFWMVRGINNCEIESNIVAGQPNLDKISYPGTVEKYGWGLQYPDKNIHTIIPQEENKITFYQNNKYSTLYLDSPENDSTVYLEQINAQEWKYVTVKKPSPYTFFWTQERPVYFLGKILNKLNDIEDESVINLEEKTIENLNKIIEIQKNPILILNDEQLQLVKINNFSEIIVFRGVNNTIIKKHSQYSNLNIIPYNNLTPDELQFLPVNKPVYSQNVSEVEILEKLESPKIPDKFYQI